MRLRAAISLFILSLSPLTLFAQGPEKDSLFRLVYADEAQQIEEHSCHYRRVRGNADFLHNNAHLYCDSASWNIENKYIEAFGNVRVVQDNTILRSEQMQYDIDGSLAHFNGGVVELVDKDGNTLRTMELDYNTQDSVAFFFDGGAMIDTAGNAIESKRGSYRTADKVFEFEKSVEMYMDSILVRTTKMDYRTDEGKAYFGTGTYMWKDDGFLKADAGWYDRDAKTIHFESDVYMNDPQYEVWSDDLYYNQASGEVNMYQNSQILDTLHKSYYTADHILYERDTVDGRVVLSRDPAIIFFGENENHEVDTLYARADTILIYSVKKNDIPKEEIEASVQRLEDINFDTLQKKREEFAKKRESEAVEKLRLAGKLPPAKDSVANEAPLDTLNNLQDTSALSVLDTIPAAPPDTTHIRQMFAYHDVRMFRSDSQVKCDSLVFSALDSVARLYGSPVMWNEEKNQLTSETMSFLMKNGNLYRGSMVTDAWLISRQDSLYFDQIKCTEMMGYFHESKLYRFDALGGVNTIFYLNEHGELTTVNVKSSKSMSAMIKDGSAQRLIYLEEVKSDAFPLLQLENEKHRLKDFNWRGDERPTSPSAITSRIPRSSERERFSHVEAPSYSETDLYFDGYMSNVLDSLERRRLARVERKRLQDSLDAAPGVNGEELPVTDSLSEVSVDMPLEDAGKESAAAASLEKKTLSRAEKRALKKAERRAARRHQS